MKILFDYQIFEGQKYGGISRYFYELISHFDKDQTMDWELPILYSNNYYLKSIASVENKLSDSPEIKIHPFDQLLETIDFPGKWRVESIKEKYIQSVSAQRISLNKKQSIEILKKGDFDVFHPTFYDNYFLDFIGTKPYVVTVYDLIVQLFPEYYSNVGIDKNKEIIQKASMIIAISENTKRDLVSVYGIDEKKVAVTHLATSLNPSELEVSPSFREELPAKYLLFVGDRFGYKNFLFFAQAFAVVAEREKDLFMVCTGSPFQAPEIAFFRKLNILDKVRHYSAADNQLAFLYKSALAFVFPSMYEGFGIPVLEAFACSCPVILSRSSSLSEIGEDAVIYFEPKNITILIKAIDSVLHEPGIRHDLISRGASQLKKFSWEKTTAATTEIYKQVLALNQQ